MWRCAGAKLLFLSLFARADRNNASIPPYDFRVIHTDKDSKHSLARSKGGCAAAQAPQGGELKFDGMCDTYKIWVVEQLVNTHSVTNLWRQPRPTSCDV
jgi:hypothetical protein